MYFECVFVTLAGLSGYFLLPAFFHLVALLRPFQCWLCIFSHFLACILLLGLKSLDFGEDWLSPLNLEDLDVFESSTKVYTGKWPFGCCTLQLLIQASMWQGIVFLVFCNFSCYEWVSGVISKSLVSFFQCIFFIITTTKWSWLFKCTIALSLPMQMVLLYHCVTHFRQIYVFTSKGIKTGLEQIYANGLYTARQTLS